MTKCCISSHSTGTSRTHRTCWWAWRARTGRKIILLNIYTSFNVDLKVHPGDLNALVFFPRALLVLVALLDLLAKLEKMYVHISVTAVQNAKSFLLPLFCEYFASGCGSSLLWPKVYFTDSQGNNGRPGKPGDRGVPGPQVRDLHHDNHKQI